MTTLYGIRNCDTVKRARGWLDANGVGYVFHDYKVAGVDAAGLDRWIAAVGWERLLNRAGTTFRKLPEAERDGVDREIDRERARAIMLAHPSAIRRPVLERDGAILVGFSSDSYAAHFT